MSYTTLTALTLLALSATTVTAGRFQGRSLRNADVCGHYGVCESGFWCGDVDAKQCFKAPEPEEVCSEEDMCLEDLEECGPETYCKYDERCVKDTECYAKWEEYSKKDHKEGEEVQESSCYKCEPIVFEDVCKKVWVDSCKKVLDTECEEVPTEECASVPEIECKKVEAPKKVCKDVIEKKCHDVPKKVCGDGKQDCHTISPCQAGSGAGAGCSHQTCIYTVTDNACRREKGCKPLYRGDHKSECDCQMSENCFGKCHSPHQCSASRKYPQYSGACSGLSADRCHSYTTEVCKDSAPVCHEEYETVCEDVTRQVCDTVSDYEKECKKVWKDKCETVYVKQCYPQYKQKCSMEEVEKCAPAEGIECGKDTCALGQKCGKDCKIVEKEVEECKNITIKACIPEE